MFALIFKKYVRQKKLYEDHSENVKKIYKNSLWQQSKVSKQILPKIHFDVLMIWVNQAKSVQLEKQCITRIEK